MSQNPDDTGGSCRLKENSVLPFLVACFLSSDAPWLPRNLSLLPSSRSLSSFPLYLISSPPSSPLPSICHFLLVTPSMFPSLHLFNCHTPSLSLRSHRNCWVIPLTGTAQLIGLNSFWQILSLSSCSPCFPEYVLFCHNILQYTCPSFLFSFPSSSSLLILYLPKPFRPLAFLFIFFFTVDAWWQVSVFSCFLFASLSIFLPWYHEALFHGMYNTYRDSKKACVRHIPGLVPCCVIAQLIFIVYTRHIAHPPLFLRLAPYWLYSRSPL